MEFTAIVVNLFNSRRAKGTISGAGLYTADEAKNMESAILSRIYIRPFPVEFGMKYKFETKN